MSSGETVTKLSGARAFGRVLADQLRDPEFRAEWERTALARALAIAVLRYRTENGLSQRALAARLGWRQPQVARLETGEHNPTLETLLTVARTLGFRVLLAVGPPGQDLPVQVGRSDIVERAEDERGSFLAAVNSVGNASDP